MGVYNILGMDCVFCRKTKILEYIILSFMYRHNIFINNGTKHIYQVYQNAIERILFTPFPAKTRV